VLQLQILVLKKRLQRAREYLTGAGVIGSGGNGLVWWTGKPLRAFPHTIPRQAQPLDTPLIPTDVLEGGF